MNFLKIILVLTSFSVFGYDSVKVDISNRWKAFDDSIKTKVSSERVLHLELKSSDAGLFEIEMPNSFSVFINSQLVGLNQRSIHWNLDSLKTIYVFPVRISIFSKRGLSKLSTKLIKWDSKIEFEKREKRIVSAISITAFVLLWALILLFYTNGIVMLEYFSFLRIFSIRSTDENVLSQRVTSLNNIFVYCFCSVLMAVNLILFGRDPEDGLTVFTIMNVLSLAGGILMLFLAKIFLTGISAKIFSLTEFAPGQFFNFVRLLLGCFVISSICLVLIFILGIDRAPWKNIIYGFFLIMFGYYFIATFFRLSSRRVFTVFHLFSYLCLSEIFPVLLLLKIYYF